MAQQTALSPQLAKEIRLFSRYLLKKDAPATAVRLYAHRFDTPGATESKAVAFVLRHTWSISLIDAGLAFTKPDDELRYRLFTLFAILESMPELSDYFLSRERSPLYMIVIAGIGVAAAIRVVLGIVLIKVNRL